MMSKFKIIARVSGLIFIFAVANSVHAQNCPKYEPAPVKLQGIISRQTFAGRPNYESVKAGDEPEKYWVLHLSRSICVENTPGSQSKDDYQETETNVRRVQLVLTPEQYARWRKLANRHAQIVATGTLFHAFTGHHHTRVLLSVADLKRLKS